jgi:hypothetical protein
MGTQETKNKIIERVGIALAGFMGGIGPSLAEFVSLTKQQTMPQGSFFIGAFIMGIMGLAVALIAKETVPWKAFTQGMGAPALFSSATTAVTSMACLISPIGTAYGQTDSLIKISDSIVVIVDEIVMTKIQGDTITLEKKGIKGSYVLPQKDTVVLNVEVHDPLIRRSIIQGLLPMQKNLTQKFEPKLVVKENGN